MGEGEAGGRKEGEEELGRTKVARGSGGFCPPCEIRIGFVNINNV